MAGITFGAEEKKYQTKVPAKDGYSFSYAPVPNKVLVGAGTSGQTANAGANINTGANTNTNTNQNTNAGAGAGTAAGGTNKVSSSPVSVVVGGTNSRPISVGNTSSANAVTPQQQAETALADLREQYAANLRERYNGEAERMRGERDEALRENWILQQQAEAALPEQLAARGINGGATETSLANLRAQYQGNRNDINAGYAESLGELANRHSEEAAEGDRSYNERWLEYLLALAEMEAKSKYD